MASSTQQFLNIEDIREGALILKNRAIRGILMVSSQNFALKSQEEQDAVIFQFQNFLNSLDFFVQITVQSRRLNITGYIDKLKQLEQAQTNPLLQIQTKSYRQFIEQMIAGGSVLAKNFFVIVPFTLIEALPAADQRKKGGIFSKTPKVKGPLSDEDFDRMKNQLWQRMEFVSLGLRRCGLHVTPLNTEEIIELFWSWYHPDEAEVGYYPSVPPELLRRGKPDNNQPS